MNFLVTGGNGFIGSHLVDALSKAAENHVTVFDYYPRTHYPLPKEVSFVQGSISDMDLLRRTLEDQNIQTVYHLAWASIPESSLENLASDVETNLIPSVNLLNACQKSGVKRFIYVSSGGTVYGTPQICPVSENHPTNPISAYGITKLMVEKYVQMFSHLYGMEYVILRPSVPYGPRQNPHRRQGVVSVFTYNALLNRPVTIWGNGESIIRDYFYIDDMVNALISANQIPFEKDSIFNLAGNRTYNLNELVEVIEKVLGTKVRLNLEPPRTFDVPVLNLDISRARQKLNWNPSISLEEGIQLTARWLRELPE